jgi:methanogenic corrinoid protein MtbC1
MAFLRVKRSRNRVYAYLVESRWDPSLGHPRQHVIAYLGRPDQASVDSIPVAYRTPSLIRALDALAAEDRSRRQSGAVGLRSRFLEALLAGNRPNARSVARTAMRELGPEGFFRDVFVPSLHEIGRRFSRREISISSEHLATGLAAGILSEINASLPEGADDAPEVVLCVPEGETHTLALQIAEGFLRRKGYRVLNVGGSAPNASVLDFVRTRRPKAVLISFTLPDRLEAGWKLARRLLQEIPGIRVAVGGQGTAALRSDAPPKGLDIVHGPVEEYLRDWPNANGENGSASLPGARGRHEPADDGGRFLSPVRRRV